MSVFTYLPLSVYWRCVLQELSYNYCKLQVLQISARLEVARNENFGPGMARLDTRAPAFWKVAKVLKNRPKPVPPLVRPSDNLIMVTPEAKANALAEQFASAHMLGLNMPSPFEADVDDSLSFVDEAQSSIPRDNRVTTGKIHSALKRLKNMRAPGFDGIFNTLLKHLQDKAICLLTNIFTIDVLSWVTSRVHGSVQRWCLFSNLEKIRQTP